MNKTFFIATFVSCNLFLVSSSFALNPVIIKKSQYGAPPANNKLSDDSNYFPNDVGLTCKGTYDISQTFDPKCTTTTDAEGNKSESCTPYSVDKIEGPPPVFNAGKWTNNAGVHFSLAVGSNPVKTLLGDPNDTKKAFLSYDPNKTVGSFGSATKNMPSLILRCLKGQRMVKAVLLANDKEGGVYSNEQIAWDNGSKYIPVTDTKQNEGKKVQLDDLAISLNKNPFLSLTETTPDGRAIVGTTQTYLFYDPNANCFDTNPETAPIAGPLGAFGPESSPTYEGIPPEDAVALWKTLSAYDSSASRRTVITCSKNAITGEEFDCQTEKTNQPRGGGFATSPFMANMLRPKLQDVPSRDLCVTNPNQNIADKPNPVTFSLKQVIKNFGEITKEAKNFAFPLSYTYRIDANIQKGISADEVQNRNFLPASAQKDPESCLANSAQGYSSTDGKSFDPGNDCSRKESVKWLLPKSQQIL